MYFIWVNHCLSSVIQTILTLSYNYSRLPLHSSGFSYLLLIFWFPFYTFTATLFYQLIYQEHSALPFSAQLFSSLTLNFLLIKSQFENLVLHFFQPHRDMIFWVTYSDDKVLICQNEKCWQKPDNLVLLSTWSFLSPSLLSYFLASYSLSQLCWTHYLIPIPQFLFWTFRTLEETINDWSFFEKLIMFEFSDKD